MLPWIAAGAAVLAVVSLVAILFWAFARVPDTDGAQASVATETARYGTIQLEVDPPIPVELWVNGKTVAMGTGIVAYDRLEPGGSVQVEVKAPGYSPYRALLVPHAGQAVQNQIRLEKTSALPDVEVPVAPTMVVLTGYRLETTPRGATVYIDGAERGITPYEWTNGVPGQTYDVEFRKPDSHQPLMKKITFPKTGGVATKTVQLQGLEGNGTVVINVVNDKAEVYVDGQSIGVQSMTTRQLKAGTHKISAVFREGRRDDRFVTVEKDKETRVSLERPL